MAFVRWRGGSPSLVATLYEHGRSRQVHLATFNGMRYVEAEVRAQAQARWPHITVDWDAVDLALAKGPPGDTSARTRDTAEWAEIEHSLRFWAAMEPANRTDAQRLLAAAHVLCFWRIGVPFFHRPSPPAGWDAVGTADRGVAP